MTRRSRRRSSHGRGGVALLAAVLYCTIVPARQAFDLRVDAPPELAPLARRVGAIDAESLAGSLALAGLNLPPRVHLQIVPSADVRAGSVPPWVAGRAFGTDRIVIFPDHIRSYPYDSLESVVLHEIVHLSLNARAGGRPLPRWFHEGVAVSVESGWGLGSQARLLLAAARDPEIDEVGELFRSDRQSEATTAYLLAAALVEDVRRRHGLTMPGAIAARVARGESFDGAFFAETGETVDQAAAQAWRVYRGVRWLPIVTSGSALWGIILVIAFVAFAVRLRRRRRKRWEEEEEEEEEEDTGGQERGQEEDRRDEIGEREDDEDQDRER